MLARCFLSWWIAGDCLQESEHMRPPISTSAPLDALAAWQSASSMVAANRDVMLAIAGVFFLLPSLVFAVFVPAPVMPAGVTGTDAFKLMQDFYSASFPYLLAITVLQIAGIQALLIVMTDKAFPTVAQAIGMGFRETPVALLAQFLFGIGLGLLLVVVVGLASVTGVPAVATAATLITIAIGVNLFLRFLLIAPVIAVERLRNPVAVLRRSWALTRGQVGRLALFFGLALLLYLVVSSLVMMVVSLILAFVTQGEVQRVLVAAVSSAITAGAVVYFAAMLGAVYRQLIATAPNGAGFE